MPNTKIEEFATILTKHVRDESIRSCDRRLRQDAKGHVAERWKQLIQEANMAINGTWTATAQVPHSRRHRHPSCHGSPDRRLEPRRHPRLHADL